MEVATRSVQRTVKRKQRIAQRDKARVWGRRTRAFGEANSERPVAAHACIVKCAEYGAKL